MYAKSLYAIAPHVDYIISSRMTTLREWYSLKHQKPEAKYAEHEVRSSFYFPARWLYPVILWPSPKAFVADFDFINYIGSLTSKRDFDSEARAYHSWPANLAFPRRVLRMHVSSTKLRRLIPLSAAGSLPHMSPRENLRLEPALHH